MKKLRNILLGFITVVVFVVAMLYATDNEHLIHAVASTYLVGTTGPSIDEYEISEHRTVKTGEHQPWPRAEKIGTNHLNDSQVELLNKYETVAFLVLEKGEIVFEEYWEGFGENSLTNSFSVAKTIVSLLVGIAIDEGKIESVNDAIERYIPEWKGKPEGKITIKKLLQMASHLNFDEQYGDPFGFMAKAYYGDELREKTLSYKLDGKPGEEWEYLGGNTLLLSFVVESATGKTLADYASEKLWQPLGAENEALWSLDDKDGIERAYCCFYSNARDFAKLGQLALCNGKWNEQLLISSEWIQQSWVPVMISNTEGEVVDYYGYQWWIGEHFSEPFYFMRGILGQYVFVLPEREMVVVRLGKKRSNDRVNHHPADVYDWIDIALSFDNEE